MKKIIVFIVACAMALCASSCRQAPGLLLQPESVTIKVGETTTLTAKIQGDGIEIDDIRIVNSKDGVCFLDSSYNLKGLKAGQSTVGIAIWKDKDDESKGFKYSAFTVVTVVE